MSKRTKSKLRDFKIFLSKEVFNGRYVVRNILVMTIIAALIATTVGTTVLAAQDNVTEVEVEKPIPKSYSINSLDTDVISMDSIGYLLAELDADSATGVEANETIVVSGTNTTKGIVTDNDVFVRAEASYMGDVIATAYLDEEYVVDKSKSDDEWVCIVLDDNKLGYINAMFITVGENEEQETEAADEDAEEVEGNIVAVTGGVTETESSSSQVKPVQESGTAEKVDDTPEPTTEAVVETPAQDTTEETTESASGDTTEETTESTTEAPVTTEQESSDKPYREDAVVNAGVPVETTYRAAITLSEEDINLLATIVTLESGGESYDGQLAVANVIINRLNSGHWGSTVADVVYAPYQFSCTSSPMLDYYLANGAQESARQATLEALSGVNNIGNYMCFRAIYVTDLEDYSVYSVIGNHVFH